MLEKLHGAGAPVPEFLGAQGALLFQSDVGKGRLSTQLHRRDREGQIALAEAAFASLWEIKRAARDSGSDRRGAGGGGERQMGVPVCNGLPEAGQGLGDRRAESGLFWDQSGDGASAAALREVGCAVGQCGGAGGWHGDVV